VPFSHLPMVRSHAHLTPRPARPTRHAQRGHRPSGHRRRDCRGACGRGCGCRARLQAPPPGAAAGAAVGRRRGPCRRAQLQTPSGAGTPPAFGQTPGSRRWARGVSVSRRCTAQRRRTNPIDPCEKKGKEKQGYYSYLFFFFTPCKAVLPNGLTKTAQLH
jgi:hypothetical protein